MTFLDTRLDSKITHGARSCVRWSRLKAYTGSGKLQQTFNWANAKHEMDVSHGLRSRADYQTVLDLFYVIMAGGYVGFRLIPGRWPGYVAGG